MVGIERDTTTPATLGSRFLFEVLFGVYCSEVLSSAKNYELAHDEHPSLGDSFFPACELWSFAQIDQTSVAFCGFQGSRQVPERFRRAVLHPDLPGDTAGLPPLPQGAGRGAKNFARDGTWGFRAFGRNVRLPPFCESGSSWEVVFQVPFFPGNHFQ